MREIAITWYVPDAVLGGMEESGEVPRFARMRTQAQHAPASHSGGGGLVGLRRGGQRRLGHFHETCCRCKALEALQKHAWAFRDNSFECGG